MTLFNVFVLRQNVLLFGRLIITATYLIFFFIAAPKGEFLQQGKGEKKNPSFPEQAL